MKSGNLNFLEPFGPLQACNGTALPFFITLLILDNTSQSLDMNFLRHIMERKRRSRIRNYLYRKEAEIHNLLRGIIETVTSVQSCVKNG
jgi:hypothetical protein